jgi:hypothetical protein
MVVQPLLTVRFRHNRAKLLASEEWQLVSADVRSVAERSAMISRDRERGYVSATSVAVALGQMSEDLATTSLQIWGPSSDKDIVKRRK